jgi:L-alanine-DL-glutamate epimerase-like enolase superfamily enzyme
MDADRDGKKVCAQRDAAAVACRSQETPVIRNGFMYIPDEPGLGATLHRAFVQKYQVEG